MALHCSLHHKYHTLSHTCALAMIYLKCFQMLSKLKTMLKAERRAKDHRNERNGKKIKKKLRCRGVNVQRDRMGSLRNIESLPDYVFKMIFRLDKETFAEVLALIDPILVKNRTKGMANVKGNLGSTISSTLMLLATLRFLAGGQCYDICLSLNIGIGSFWGERGVIWPTMRALDEVYEIGISLNDENEMRKITEEFSAICKDGKEEFYGCCMAIDGWVCETRMPLKKETPDVKSYRNRKGLWGMTVLAGCDARTKFMMFSCNGSGSANDILAWRSCHMNNEILKKGRLPTALFFIGDEAFGCEDQLLVPWSGRGIGVEKDAFNFHLSVRRQVIERAFGILTKRWGIFNRPLNCRLSRWTLVATVAAKMHNLCIDKNIPTVSRYAKDIMRGDAWNVFVNQQPDDVQFQVRASGELTGGRRKAITARLAMQSIRRPPHSQVNSRA